MDEDRFKGAATNVGGKVEDAVGGLTGNGKTQAEGKLDQVSGQVQNAYGSAKDTIREGTGSLGAQLDEFMKERPLASLLAAAGVGYMLAKMTQSSRR